MPHFKASFGGAFQDAEPWVRNSANTGWVKADKVYTRNDANTGWTEVWKAYTPLGVYVPNVSVYESDRVAPYDSSRVLTKAATPSISGGQAPITGTYTRLSGDVFTVSGNTFSTSVNQNSSRTAVYRYTVSDGQTSASSDFTLSFAFDSGVPV